MRGSVAWVELQGCPTLSQGNSLLYPQNQSVLPVNQSQEEDITSQTFLGKLSPVAEVS